MKLIKILGGSLGVLLSIQPMVTWASNGNDQVQEQASNLTVEPLVIHADGSRPIIIEGLDSQADAEIQSQDTGKKIITIRTGHETIEGAEKPTCGGTGRGE